MMQKAERQEEIEKVRSVFGAYIEDSPYLELLWSDKLGYILMLIHRGTSEIMESRIITDAESFCRYLIREISQNALKAMGKDHDTYELSSSERAEIRKELRPYLEQLPEYDALFHTVF